MPRTALLPALVAGYLVLYCAACDGDDALGTRLAYPPTQLEIGAGLNPVEAHTFVLPQRSTDHGRLERETGVPWADWQRVTPLRASLRINEPGLGWGFANEVVVRAYTDDPRVARELFYRDNIFPDEGPLLDLIPSEADVRDLLDGERVTFVVELRRIAQSPPQSLPVTLEMSFQGYTD